MASVDNDESLIQGLQVLTTIARRGPLDLRRLARLNGWHWAYAAALIEVLEGHGLVSRTADEEEYCITATARLLIEPVCPPTLH